MKHQSQNCTYCGRINPETYDHIPPACLFPPPRPSNLITVPCCSSCNASASKDDEYFKMIFAIRHDMGNQPAGQKLLDSVLRGLENPRKRGMLRSLLRSMKRVSLHSPAGLYLGDTASYNADLIRLGRVTNRVVRGLYYKESNIRLADTHDVRSFALSGLQDINSILRSRVRNYVTILKSKQPRIIGEGVFEYWYDTSPEDSNTSAWLLRFFASE